MPSSSSQTCWAWTLLTCNCTYTVHNITFHESKLTAHSSIADQYAANGYFVAIPDLFDGNVVPMNPPADFDVGKWIREVMPHPPTVDPKIEKVIKHLRGELGVKKLGGVGHCFGGKYVCRWLKTGGRGVDVGFTAHPSFVDAEELKGIEGPLSIAAAGMSFAEFVLHFVYLCAYNSVLVFLMFLNIRRRILMVRYRN
jgi:hypothetical protein